METIWSLIDSWSIKYALRDLLWSSVQSKHRHTVLTESSVELRLGDCQEKKQLDKSWHIDALTSLLKRSSWQQCFSKNKLQQRMRKLNWRRRWKRQVQKNRPRSLPHALSHDTQSVSFKRMQVQHGNDQLMFLHLTCPHYSKITSVFQCQQKDNVEMRFDW